MGGGDKYLPDTENKTARQLRITSKLRNDVITVETVRTEI